MTYFPRKNNISINIASASEDCHEIPLLNKLKTKSASDVFDSH